MTHYVNSSATKSYVVGAMRLDCCTLNISLLINFVALTVDACGNLATPLVDISFTTTFDDLKIKVTEALSSTVYIKD